MNVEERLRLEVDDRAIFRWMSELEKPFHAIRGGDVIAIVPLGAELNEGGVQAILGEDELPDLFN